MSDIRIALHWSGSHLLQTHFLMLAEQNRKRLGGRGEETKRRRRDREMLTKINDCNIELPCNSDSHRWAEGEKENEKILDV